MKKRRELDALVNGKMGRRKKKGQHELLRDTESSDVEEFAIPPKTVVRKRSSSSRICSTCLMGCGLFLLTICVVAVAGIVWVHIELKKDVDNLRTQLRKVELGSKPNQDDLQSLHTKQQELENKINKEIDDQKNQLNTLIQQVKVLNSTAQTLSGLSKSFTDVPELHSLPKDMQGLKQQIADFGSGVKSMQDDVQKLEDRVKKLEDENTNIPSVTPSPAANTVSPEQLTHLSEKIGRVNATLTVQMSQIKLYLNKQKLNVEEFHNDTLRMDTRLSLLELRLPVTGPANENKQMESLIQAAINDAMDDLRNMTATGEGVDPLVVATLRAQITNITGALHTLEANVSQLAVGPVSRSMNISLDNQKHISSLNASVVQLEETVKYQDGRLGDLEALTTQQKSTTLPQGPAYERRTDVHRPVAPPSTTPFVPEKQPATKEVTYFSSTTNPVYNNQNLKDGQQSQQFPDNSRSRAFGTDNGLKSDKWTTTPASSDQTFITNDQDNNENGAGYAAGSGDNDFKNSDPVENAPPSQNSGRRGNGASQTRGDVRNRGQPSQEWPSQGTGGSGQRSYPTNKGAANSENDRTQKWGISTTPHFQSSGASPTHRDIANIGPPSTQRSTLGRADSQERSYPTDKGTANNGNGRTSNWDTQDEAENENNPKENGAASSWQGGFDNNWDSYNRKDGVDTSSTDAHSPPVTRRELARSFRQKKASPQKVKKILDALKEGKYPDNV